MYVYVIEVFSSDTNDWHLSSQGIAYPTREAAESRIPDRIAAFPDLKYGPMIRDHRGQYTGECGPGIRVTELVVVTK